MRTPADARPASWAPLVFIASGISMYAGSALGVRLFDLASPLSVGWARAAVASLVLLAWRRPWRTRWTRRDLLLACAFGVVLVTMNIAFYASIAHIDLGVAVTLEYLGPVVVAAIGARGLRGRVAVLLGLAGVAAIGGLALDLGNPGERLGAGLALGAGALWAFYILLGRRVASSASGLDSLAVGMGVGALVWVPLGAPGAGPLVFPGPGALVVAVALLSSVVPYVLDQVVLRRLSAPVFALLTALLPLTSVVVGAVMLGQLPGAWDLVGLTLVSAAVALAMGDPAAADTPGSGRRTGGERDPSGGWT